MEKLDFYFLCATGQCYKYKTISLSQCLRGGISMRILILPCWILTALCLDTHPCATQVWHWVLFWAGPCLWRQGQILRPCTASSSDNITNLHKISTSESCNIMEASSSLLNHRSLQLPEYPLHTVNMQFFWKILSNLGVNQENLTWSRKGFHVVQHLEGQVCKTSLESSSKAPTPTLLRTKPTHRTVSHSSQTCFWLLRKRRKAGHCALPSSSSLHCQVSYSFITP